MSNFIIILLLLCNTSSSIISNWMEPSSPLLSQTMESMSVGYYSPTNSIFLFGGKYDGAETAYINYVTEYDITTNQYIYHHNINVGNFASTSQAYTTIGNTIYTWESISKDSIVQHPYISTFNMATKQYTATAISKPSTDTNMFNVCLTQLNDRYLIALGGSTKAWSYSNRFRIYDTITQTWLTDGTPLLRSIHAGACAIGTDSNGNQWLYYIGGQDPTESESNGHLWDVDRVQINDINNIGQWNRLSQHLSFGVYGNRAVSIGDKIYAIGGWKGNDPRTEGYMVVVSAVDIIDVNTNTISAGNNLVTAVSGHGVVVAEEQATIYVFGGTNIGWPNHVISNKMQYMQYAETTTTTTTTSTTTTDVPSTTKSETSMFTTTLSYDNHMTTVKLTESENIPFNEEHIGLTFIDAMVICACIFLCCSLILIGLYCFKRHKQNNDTNASYSFIDNKVNQNNNIAINVEMNANNNESLEKVRVSDWIKNIGFPQYINNFLNNGYDSIELIKDITNKNELNEIDITMVAHQNRIIKQIKLLRNDTSATQQQANVTWNNKNVSEWTTNDTLQWIDSINLSQKWKENVEKEIKNKEWTGNDIMSVTSKQDIKIKLNINNPMLCGRLWKEIRNISNVNDTNEGQTTNF